VRYESIKPFPHRHSPPRSADALFRMAQPGVSQVLVRRVLRQRGNSILSLPRQGVGAAARHRPCPDPRNQRVALHPQFHLFLYLPLFRLHQEAEGVVVELTLRSA
jgi:hypothetical protein